MQAKRAAADKERKRVAALDELRRIEEEERAVEVVSCARVLRT
jgi:hypothetical protein